METGDRVTLANGLTIVCGTVIGVESRIIVEWDDVLFYGHEDSGGISKWLPAQLVKVNESED